jgi:phosphatidylglycerophosphatase A
MPDGGSRSVDRVARWIYAAGPSGHAPIAPGTFGSAFAAVFLFLPGRVPGIPEWSLPFATVLFVVVLAAGVWSARRAELIYGKDPGIVVIDEVAGMVVTLAALPNSVAAIVLGFFLFRVMDILKPFPVRLVERAPGSWGVMLDDVMAGIYANLLLRVALFLWGSVFA